MVLSIWRVISSLSTTYHYLPNTTHQPAFTKQQQTTFNQSINQKLKIYIITTFIYADILLFSALYKIEFVTYQIIILTYTILFYHIYTIIICRYTVFLL